METRYLLPCRCGRKVQVEPRQAGEEIGCDCGASLEAPTMLRMAALERVHPEADSRQAPSPWGSLQGMVFLGTIIVLAALVGSLYLVLTRPTLPSAEIMQSRTEALTPVESWYRWQALRAAGVEYRRKVDEKAFANLRQRYRLWLGVDVTVGLAGVALILIPLLLQKRLKKQSR